MVRLYLYKYQLQLRKSVQIELDRQTESNTNISENSQLYSRNFWKKLKQETKLTRVFRH